MKRSSALFNLEERLPGDFIIMSEQYRSLVALPVWHDYTGHLLGIKAAMERQLISGSFGPAGEDQTPLVRSAYALLVDIIAIPDKIEQRRAYVESELLSLAARPTAEPSTATWEHGV